MITAFKIQNFKSYQDASVPLAPLTVMIGANASGKSNAIEALRLLSWLAQGQKLSSIQYNLQSELIRGQAKDLFFPNTNQFTLSCTTDLSSWSELSIEIGYREDGLHIVGETIGHEGGKIPLYELDQPSEGVNTSVKVGYNQFAPVEEKPQITCNDQLAIFTQLISPAAFGNEHRQSQKVIPETVTKYQEWLSNILFLDPVPSRMRGYSFPNDGVLRGDGENLSSILFSIWNRPDNSKDRLLEFIQSLPEQDIQDIDFLHAPRGEVMLTMHETFGGIKKSYDAALLSDGTLRVLAIAAALLSAKPNSLVVIEEIDNGVHPSRAKHLLEQIKKTAEERSLRVLLSTHNPALLNALPLEAVPQVIFCYRSPQSGSSQTVRLDDVENYPELVAQGPLGQLMTNGLLERFIKFNPSSEEKLRASLAWLESIK